MSNVTDVFLLDANSVEAREALLNGSIKQGLNRVRVVPGDVIAAGSRKIAFRKVTQPRPSKLKSYAESLRAISLTATALPGLAIWALGMLRGEPIDGVSFALALVGATLLQIAVNVLNDVEDHLKLIDLPGGVGGSQTIQRGWVSARELRFFGFFCLVGGTLLGVPVLMKHLSLMLPIGIVAVVGTLGYSSKPFGFKYRALGDVDVFLLCGPLLTAGFSIAAFGKLGAATWYLGSFFGFAACAILHVNNMQDIHMDSARGAKTLASKIGFRKSTHLLAMFYVLAYLSLMVGVLSSQLPISTLSAFLALPLFVKILQRSYAASGSDSPLLNGLRVMAAQGHLGAGVAMVLAFVCARYFL